MVIDIVPVSSGKKTNRKAYGKTLYILYNKPKSRINDEEWYN